MSKIPGTLYRLIGAMERLASSAHEQRAYLAALGVEGLTDELALEFDDALQPLRHEWDALGVSDRAAAAIEDLSSALQAMSGGNNEELWRPDALDRAEWSAVRTLAGHALQELRNEVPDA